jgi:hypothetical protein
MNGHGWIRMDTKGHEWIQTAGKPLEKSMLSCTGKIVQCGELIRIWL